ncbi:MAG TPA: PilX N-terminal domain-containing pilus assembly protein [Steroidobacteraceae bacterium]|nr:PilX N-terminal domain-containing pilus assembly protein [Steroidobacteraceae bacterium]
MNRKISPPFAAQREQGAALIVGLILLLVLTILAVSGVLTSTLELRMVGNQQQQERAFQAADTAIEIAIASATFSTTGEVVVAPTPVDATDPDGDQYEYVLRFESESSLPTVPTGYSLGSGFQAYHFAVDSVGTSSGGANSEHAQGFYIVGPGGS